MKYVPFSEDEMKVVGEYLRPTEPVGMPATPKLNTPVTPKENVRAAWKHEGALWIPSVGRDTICLEPRINVDHVARAEVRDLEPPYTDETKGGPDLFGVIWEYVPVVGGSMVQPGNPVLEDVNDWPEIIKFPISRRWTGPTARKSTPPSAPTSALWPSPSRTACSSASFPLWTLRTPPSP